MNLRNGISSFLVATALIGMGSASTPVNAVEAKNRFQNAVSYMSEKAHLPAHEMTGSEVTKEFASFFNPGISPTTQAVQTLKTDATATSRLLELVKKFDERKIKEDKTWESQYDFAAISTDPVDDGLIAEKWMVLLMGGNAEEYEKAFVKSPSVEEIKKMHANPGGIAFDVRQFDEKTGKIEEILLVEFKNEGSFKAGPVIMLKGEFQRPANNTKYVELDVFTGELPAQALKTITDVTDGVATLLNPILENQLKQEEQQNQPSQQPSEIPSPETLPSPEASH